MYASTSYIAIIDNQGNIIKQPDSTSLTFSGRGPIFTIENYAICLRGGASGMTYSILDNNGNVIKILHRYQDYPMQ